MTIAEQIKWLIKKYTCLSKCCEEVQESIVEINELVELSNVRAYFGNSAGLNAWTNDNLGYGLFWFEEANNALHFYNYGDSTWIELCTDCTGGLELLGYRETGTPETGITVDLGDFNTVNNGTKIRINDTSRTIALVGQTEINIKTYTFAQIAGLTPTVGQLCVVTDSGPVTYRSILAGGGANVALVMYDGTNWLYH